MSATIAPESALRIPGVHSRFLEPAGSSDSRTLGGPSEYGPSEYGTGRLRYLTGGTGAPWSCCTPCAPRPSTSAT